MKSRLRRLEQEALARPEPPCPECGDRIVYEVVCPDGTSSYMGGDPCEACGSQGNGGGICRIVVVYGDDGDGGELQESEVIEWP